MKIDMRIMERKARKRVKIEMKTVMKMTTIFMKKTKLANMKMT